MRGLFSIAFAASILVLSGTSAMAASPLTLDYNVTQQSDGTYLYDFALVMDNNDGSWVKGQQWNLIVFGDKSAKDTLSGFCPAADAACGNDAAANTVPPAGWIATASYGGHIGPTLMRGDGFDTSGWKPRGVNDQLRWTYVSNIDLAPGDLYFSTVSYSPTANPADFQLANYTDTFPDQPVYSSVPEAAIWAMLILGVAMIGFAVRRRQDVLAIAA